MVLAFKIISGKKVYQNWNDKAWKDLGKDTNGWQVEQDQVIQNNQVNTKSQPVSNSLPNKTVDQVVTNDVNKKEAQPATPAADQKETTDQNQNTSEDNNQTNSKESKVSGEKIADFMKHVEGLKPGVIKDHFDSLNPPVLYDNTIKLPGLKKMLGEHYKYDIVEFQKLFS